MAGPGFSVPFDSPLMRLPLVGKRKKIATSSEPVIKDKIITAPVKEKISIEKVLAGDKITIPLGDRDKPTAPPGVSHKFR